MEPYEVVLIALFTFIIGAVVGAAVMYAISSKKEDEKQINNNTGHTHTRVGSVTNTAGTKKPTETVGYHGTKNTVHTHTSSGAGTNTIETQKLTKNVGNPGIKKDFRKSSPPPPPPPPPPKRVCMGNCSTCNRDHCIEDR